MNYNKVKVEDIPRQHLFNSSIDYMKAPFDVRSVTLQLKGNLEFNGELSQSNCTISKKILTHRDY